MGCDRLWPKVDHRLEPGRGVHRDRVNLDGVPVRGHRVHGELLVRRPVDLDRVPVDAGDGREGYEQARQKRVRFPQFPERVAERHEQAGGHNRPRDRRPVQGTQADEQPHADQAARDVHRVGLNRPRVVGEHPAQEPAERQEQVPYEDQDDEREAQAEGRVQDRLTGVVRHRGREHQHVAERVEHQRQVISQAEQADRHHQPDEGEERVKNVPQSDRLAACPTAHPEAQEADDQYRALRYAKMHFGPDPPDQEQFQEQGRDAEDEELRIPGDGRTLTGRSRGIEGRPAPAPNLSPRLRPGRIIEATRTRCPFGPGRISAFTRMADPHRSLRVFRLGETGRDGRRLRDRFVSLTWASRATGSPERPDGFRSTRPPVRVPLLQPRLAERGVHRRESLVQMFGAGQLRRARGSRPRVRPLLPARESCRSSPGSRRARGALNFSEL